MPREYSEVKSKRRASCPSTLATLWLQFAVGNAMEFDSPPRSPDREPDKLVSERIPPISFTGIAQDDWESRKSAPAFPPLLLPLDLLSQNLLLRAVIYACPSVALRCGD